jgi:diaminohydroxyphosphoribosylaminopyrimidine deaminase/5-amino-6-(5-phosphoribosylamino)uracil reductase
MTPGHVPNDEAAMQLALAEARRGIGLTAPNPPVGAVILKHGQLLGRGWHQKAGGAHAEIEALRDAAAHGHDVTGATIYITLEPCSTHGRTPPCTSAILAAGPARVVWGARDPNPAHEGRAEALLQAAGMMSLPAFVRRNARKFSALLPNASPPAYRGSLPKPA